MKLVLLIAMLLMALPLAVWLRKNPRQLPKVWIAMGLLPFILTVGPHALYIAVISWRDWPGYVKGVEVSAIDICALAIYLSQPRARHATPFLFSIGLYFIAALISAFHSQVPMASLFYVWQLARTFLVYAVVARACSEDDRVAPALLTGFAIGVGLQVVMTTWQRLGHGIIQTGGTIGDKNLLGMMSQFVGVPWLALLLSGQRGWIPFLAPVGCAVTSILTVSRAAMGLNAIGMALVFIISAMRRWTSWKGKIALFGIVAIIALTPITFSSLESRFGAETSEGTYNERAAFENAAEMMISDHPMGVGANNYVIVANVGGYNKRAHVATTFGSLSTNVHNTYLLVTAETGYFGLVSFLLLLVRPMIVAFSCGWRNRLDRRGDLLLGFGITLLMVYIHCFFEWIFLEFLPMYLFAMTAGLVAGLAQQLGYWGRAQVPSSRIKLNADYKEHVATNRRVP
jgi:O-antigen ligase